MLDTQMQQRNRHSKTIRCLEARAIEESCAFAHPLRGRFELGPKWHNTPSVLPKHTQQTLPFLSVAVLLVVGPTGCSKSSSSEAAGESKPEAYPQGYVEDFDETRTKLAGFFSILLNRVLKGRLGPDRLCQDSTALEFLKNSTSGPIEVCRA